ncbi:MAG: hypothetical protein E6J90_47185 [Deltaproteobacteria bacterium]|nr:MAG: hypothetical protein E6J90_47185 [Deltaproteobacteria bacterium]TMQ10614.1 MAG: hypothetical protein E6J91_25865 [Deltaproteobacteria bacterium]
MQPPKAQVRNGRVLLDEPLDLPDRNVMQLQLVDSIVRVDGGDLDEEGRAQLHAELETSMDEADAGDTEDFARVLSELRQRL